MIRIRRALSAILSVSVFAACLVLSPSAAQAAGPEAWAQECGAPGLSLAPVLSADRENGGQPIQLRPDAPGEVRSCAVRPRMDLHQHP